MDWCAPTVAPPNALRTAPRLPLVAMARLQLLAGFEDLGTLHATLPSFGAVKRDEQFDANGVCLRVELPADQVDALKIRLRDATRDRIRQDDDQDD